ncbi:hypothetical protein ACHQM5_011109 [Ranunculus cassubicifolius]
MKQQGTWPASSEASHFSSLRFGQIPKLPSTPHHHRRPKFPPPSSSNSSPFSLLPSDILTKIAASFNYPDLRSASLVCKSWRDSLTPLREAMLFLVWGKKFKHGSGGVRVNKNKALDSFLKGVYLGSTLAMVDAGLLYWELGKKEEGIRLYMKAADLGDPAGQCNLGISFLRVEPPNPEEAVKWLYKASIAGHSRAQYQLALCLHQGRGLRRNIAEAAKWYLRAAEGGYVRAMYNTSLCYSFGEGLPKSLRHAKKWMKRAADRGHTKAQYEYGLGLFSKGDMMNALVFLELATRAGEIVAADIRNFVLGHLSEGSRDAAMQLVDNWRPMPSK